MKLRAALPAVLLLVSNAAAQSRLTGTVTLLEDSKSTPLPDALVLARSGAPAEVVAAASTDSRGRYSLTGLPAGSITLSVEAAGHYALKAGGLESETIVRSCPTSGECPSTDFELARAGVVEGWLTDPVGDPLPDAALELVPAELSQDAEPQARRSRMAGQAFSDDRGYFRIWGLRPGRYRLQVNRFAPSFFSGAFSGGGTPPTEILREVEITPGAEPLELHLGIERKPAAETFPVSGVISGLEPGEGRVALQVQPLETSGPLNFNFPVRDGAFQIPSLARGRYLFRLRRFQAGPPQARLLGEVEVSQQITDLQLAVQPPTGIRGRIEFVDAPPTRLGVRLTSRQGLGMPEFALAEAPDYVFENGGLAPGVWKLDLQGEYFLLEEAEATVSAGGLTEVALRVSNQRSTVSGVARLDAAGAREAAAHFTVAARGPRGRLKVQCDDDGRFSLPGLIPGEYEIAAWSRPDVDIDDEQAWEQARANLKKLTIELGFDIELDLTVTP